jgi:hypothetical protein
MRPTFSTLTGRFLAGVAALAIAGAALAPLPALAESKGGPTGGKGCLVENHDSQGNPTGTSTVPEGTRIGLFYCKNGEWKFGTVVLDMTGSTWQQSGPRGGGGGFALP